MCDAEVEADAQYHKQREQQEPERPAALKLHGGFLVFAGTSTWVRLDLVHAGFAMGALRAESDGRLRDANTIAASWFTYRQQLGRHRLTPR
jgi:hypothetical protein